MAEFEVWVRYRAKRGSLNVGTRVEESIARFMAYWTNTKTKEGSPPVYWQQFAPHADDRVMTLQELTAHWDDPNG